MGPIDTMTVDVAFSNNGERYNMLTINGKPTKKTFNQADRKIRLGNIVPLRRSPSAVLSV